MSEFSLQLLLSLVVGMIAGFGAHWLKDFLKARLQRSELTFKSMGTNLTVDVPVASDLQTLNERVEALAQVSPRLAILDGWELISAAIIERASGISSKDIERSQDVVGIARQIPDLDANTIERLQRFRQCRNLIAHSDNSMGIEEDATKAVKDIVPLLESIRIEWKKSGHVDTASAD